MLLALLSYTCGQFNRILMKTSRTLAAISIKNVTNIRVINPLWLVTTSRGLIIRNILNAIIIIYFNHNRRNQVRSNGCEKRSSIVHSQESSYVSSIESMNANNESLETA